MSVSRARQAALSAEQTSLCAGAVEAWFNKVVHAVNTLGLQEVLNSKGFTDFKTRCAGEPFAAPFAAPRGRTAWCAESQGTAAPAQLKPNSPRAGRFDLNPPALRERMAFLSAPEAPWMGVMRAVLGEDCHCIALGCMLSLPESVPQPFHQDGPHLSKKRHLAAHALNVFIPLTDLTEENGATEFCLATHRLDHYEADAHSVVRERPPLARLADRETTPRTPSRSR